MKLIKIDAVHPEKEKIEIVLEVLRKGGTVVYPTDTVYGLGANIFHEKAVRKVYRFKKRSRKKPVSVCLSKIEDIGQIAYLDRSAEKIIQKILPGPFTIILKKKDTVTTQITAGKDKVGVRIPDNLICREISKEFPITTTSANISGKAAHQSAEEARQELKDKPDLIIDSGPCPDGLSSTVVDLTVSPPQILRKGAGIKTLLQLINKTQS